MATPREEAIQNLLDRAAIRDVMERYTRGIDRRDWDLVASCFAPHARVNYEFVFEGEIEEAIPLFREGLSSMEKTMHFMGNQLIEVDGDRARMETYVIAHHILGMGDEQRDMIAALRYLDDLVREGDRWCIQRRTVKCDWTGQAEAAPPPGWMAPPG